MVKYVDGFVLVVPEDKEANYQKMAEEGRDLWMKHGALEYFECRGGDFKQQEMGEEKSRAFAEMAGAKSDENVWFSFIVFNSKQHRDEVNKKVMDEIDEKYKDQSDFTMPTDVKRVTYGGFGFTELDIDQAVTAFTALQWVVAARQAVVEEVSDTIKTLRAMGTHI